MMIPVVILAIEDRTDQQFMEALYRRNHQTMYRIANRSGLQEADADDIISRCCEQLIKVLDKLKEMDETTQAAYIVAVVNNAIATMFREQKRRREVGDGELALSFVADERAEVDANILTQCTMSEVRRAISMLSEIDQRVLRMKFFMKKSDAEMSNELGIKAASVRSRVSRAISRLYKKLKEMEANEL